MKFTVRYTLQAEEDLLRLYDFLLEQDLPAAANALRALTKSVEMLEMFPFSCRKAQCAEENPLLRELIIPFGNSGYVALFEIEDAQTVTILAVRHQRKAITFDTQMSFNRLNRANFASQSMLFPPGSEQIVGKPQSRFHARSG